MVAWATEIKVRAERRCGQMLRESAERGERATPEKSRRTDLVASCDGVPTLADLGLTRSQSSRYQKLAEIPEAQFEKSIAVTKEIVGEVTSASLLDQAQGKKKHAAHGRREHAGRDPAGQAEAARLQDYRAALATAVSSGADFGLCTVLRIRMSGGNRFLPP